MPTYPQTHPWLTFQLDLRQADYQLWLMLGEAQAKCQQIANSPLLPEVAETLNQLYLAKGVMATTAIEGNTLTEEEVQKRLKGQLKLPPSKEYLGQEVDNILHACRTITDEIFARHATRLTVEAICSYNRMALEQLPQAKEVNPGFIRTYSVVVGNYRGAPAEACEELLARLVTWLMDEFNAPNPAYTIAFGMLKAILAHLYLAWIHPFGDGNGRTARLIEFQLLLANGVPAASAHLLSNHYNQTRSEYYRQLDQSSRSGGNPLPFIQYALQGLLDGLNEQLERIRSQQLQVHWLNYIHQRFSDRDDATDMRRLRLMLDLSQSTLQSIDPVPVARLRHLTPRIAEAYAGKSDKTLQRDLQILEEMNLITRTAKGISAKRELMLAFLPPALER